MSELRYMISEAAKQVRVESHVLRYWEEELDLTIHRTEQGHRYYTEKDIQLFGCIRRLKDEGLSLKEVKAIVPDLIKTRDEYQTRHSAVKSPASLPKIRIKTTDVITENNLREMRSLIGAVVSQAVSENNQTLKKDISQAVTSDVLREMDILFSSKERKEEEHYRKLDSLIRQQQAYRKESVRSTPLQFLVKKF